jgi:hypothetical protein
MGQSRNRFLFLLGFLWKISIELLVAILSPFWREEAEQRGGDKLLMVPLKHLDSVTLEDSPLNFQLGPIIPPLL